MSLTSGADPPSRLCRPGTEGLDDSGPGPRTVRTATKRSHTRVGKVWTSNTRYGPIVVLGDGGAVTVTKLVNVRKWITPTCWNLRLKDPELPVVCRLGIIVISKLDRSSRLLRCCLATLAYAVASFPILYARATHEQGWN